MELKTIRTISSHQIRYTQIKENVSKLLDDLQKYCLSQNGFKDKKKRKTIPLHISLLSYFTLGAIRFARHGKFLSLAAF